MYVRVRETRVKVASVRLRNWYPAYVRVCVCVHALTHAHIHTHTCMSLHECTSSVRAPELATAVECHRRDCVRVPGKCARNR